MIMLLLLACLTTVDDSAEKVAADGSFTLALAPTRKETVFRASWETPAPADATLEYGTDGSFDHVLPLSTTGATEHSGLLIGLGAGETWQVRARSVATDGSGQQWTSNVLTVDVPAPPAALPGFTVTVPDASGVLDGFYLLTTAVEQHPWVTLVDNEGRVVWWDEGDTDGQLCEAWLSPDGQFVWWLDMGRTSSLHKTSLDGEISVDYPISGLHHDFFPMADGSLVALLWDEREYDGVGVQGDQLVEIDADGRVDRVVWSSWDQWVPDVDALAGSQPVDWTHSNSVWYDPTADEYVVSVHNFNAVIGIDRTSGAINWTVGGPTSDVELTAGEPFYTQHAARRTADGVLVFNNRDYQDGEHDLWSEAVAYTVDEESGTYTRSWSFDADKMVFNPVLGNADELEGGGHLVGFGGAGRLVRLSPQNEILFQIDADLGFPFGYVHWLPTFGGATR